MTDRQRVALIALVLLASLSAGLIIAACQAPPTEEPSRAAGNVEVIRALRVINDAAVGGDLAVTGDATLAGLTVTGGVTGTNVLVTGNQTIAGIKTFSTPAVLSGGITGPLSVTGPTAVATATPAAVVNNLGAANNAFEVRDAATPVFVVGQAGAVAAGLVNSSIPVLAKTSSYAVTAADTGAIIKSSGSITMTLPAAVVGLNYCLYNYDGGDLTIDFTDTADVALNEVNSPGDRVTNTTAFDSICLIAIDTTNWVTISSLGTWSDGN